MKKSDLKTGMRVKTVKGDYFIVIKDIDSGAYGYQEVAFVNENSFLVGSEYNEDLLYKGNRKVNAEWDIEAVFNINNSEYNLKSNILDLNKRYLIWEREEPKYYLRHKFLENEEYNIVKYELSEIRECDYLNYAKDINRFIISTKGHYTDYKTQFTLKEIEAIKEKYGVTLEDFEIMEVENE